MKFSYFLFLTVIVLFSCSSVKYEYVPTDNQTLDNINATLSRYLNDDEFYLIIKELQNEQNVLIYESNILKIDTLLYRSNILMDVANIFKINKNDDILIYFDDIKKPIILLPSQMKAYKFIYVDKKNKRIKVEFTNTPKRFLHIPGSIPEEYGAY